MNIVSSETFHLSTILSHVDSLLLLPAFQTMASKTDQDQTDAVGFSLPNILKRSNDELKIEEVEGEDTIRDKQVQVNSNKELGTSALLILNHPYQL